MFLAPAGVSPEPSRRITIPPSDLSTALAYDFRAIGRDLSRATEKIEYARQLELKLVS